MISSRKIEDLTPEMQILCNRLIMDCKAAGMDILITSTYRDFEAQNALYAQGRVTSGARVTNAKAGESFHNYRVAFDIVPLCNGKPVWGVNGEDGKLWFKIGEIGSKYLDWAGKWKTFKEFPHFQLRGITLQQLKEKHGNQ